MKQFLLVALSAAVFLFFTSSQTAAVAQADAPEKPGHLAAVGDGNVDLVGKGAFELRLVGDGVLRIPQVSKLAVAIHGQGHVVITPDDTLVVTHFRGVVKVVGKKVVVRFRHGHIGIKAKGHGKGVLTGHGVFWANGHQGYWKPDGRKVAW